MFKRLSSQPRYLPTVTLIALVGLLAVVGLRQFGVPVARAQSVSASEDALRELVARILAPRYPGATDAANFTLLPGVLPASLPVQIELPGGSRVVGSVVRGSQGTEIVLDVPLTAQEATQHFRDSFTRQGLVDPYGDGTPSGFQSTETVTSLTMCRQGEIASVNVTAYGQTSGPTDVHIRTLNAPEKGGVMCGQMPRPVQPLPRDLVPPLVAPQDVRMTSLSMDANADGVYSQALVETGQSPRSLEEHFGNQLTAAGWKRQGREVGTATATSTWTLPQAQGERTAVLVITESSALQRLLVLHVSAPAAPMPRGVARIP